MPEQWEIKSAIAHIKLARYLMSRADKRGMTHGEKHHIIEVCLSELCDALFQLGDSSYSVVTQHNDSDPTQVDTTELPGPDRSRF